MSKQRSKSSASSRGKSEMSEEGNEMSNDLHELFLDELADVYNAEQQLT